VTRLGEVFHRLGRQEEGEIIEGHILPGHVHMLVSIPPKLSVSSLVGYVKGPRVASPVRSQAPLQRTVAMGAARGFVDTAGRNTEAIRRYIQEQEDERLDQLEWPELDGGQVNRKKTRKTNVLNAALDGAHS